MGKMEANKKQQEKKGFWSLIKKSFDKSSSGCGPGCGCNTDPKKEVDKQNNEVKLQKKETNDK